MPNTDWPNVHKSNYNCYNYNNFVNTSRELAVSFDSLHVVHHCLMFTDSVMQCPLYTLLVICVVFFRAGFIILSYICSTYFMIIYASLLNEAGSLLRVLTVAVYFHHMQSISLFNINR